MDIGTIVNIILSILSFLLAAISVITVIITLRQNKKILKANESQLREMIEEHQLSAQPILILSNNRFCANRPKMFYTPPEDGYSFQSRYVFETDLENISSSTALCVDFYSEVLIPDRKDKIVFHSTVKRSNVIPASGSTKNVNSLFATDIDGCLFEALRERDPRKLPRINIEITYKNTCGGYFLCSYSYILAPEESDLETLIKWHTSIKSAPTEAKEVIEALRNTKENEKWEQIFDISKEWYNRKLGNPEIQELVLQCIEVPEKYRFLTLSKAEYEKIVAEYSYSHFVHKKSICVAQDITR